MNQFNTNDNDFNTEHLNRMTQTVYRALAQYPRTLAIRVDLRLPGGDNEYHTDIDSPCCFVKADEGMISRFFRSLDAKINADLNKKRKQGRRVHSHTLRYCWVREYGQFGKPHYHVVILLNRNNYAHLGSYDALQGNLASKIQQAWASAINVDLPTHTGLVHFPPPAVYPLDRHSESTTSQLINRLKYLAKSRSKHYQRERRSFGCSQR